MLTGVHDGQHIHLGTHLDLPEAFREGHAPSECDVHG
jgi:hypothetical protein